MIPSIKELRTICQLPVRQSEQGVFISSWYRRVSIYFTRIFLQIGVTANQCTISFIFLGVIAGILMAKGTYNTNFIAAFLFQLSYLLDYVDGEIARYRSTSSRKGLFLDLIGHHFINGALFAGLGFSTYSNNHKVLMFAFAIIAYGSVMSLYDLPLIQSFVKEKFSSTTISKEPSKVQAFTPIKSIFLLPVIIAKSCLFIVRRFLWLWSSPGFFGLTLVGAFINRLDLVLWFYGISSPIVFIRQVYVEFSKM